MTKVAKPTAWMLPSEDPCFTSVRPNSKRRESTCESSYVREIETYSCFLCSSVLASLLLGSPSYGPPMRYPSNGMLYSFGTTPFVLSSMYAKMGKNDRTRFPSSPVKSDGEK